MQPNADNLRQVYRRMHTEDILMFVGNGTLTDMAQSIALEELASRGISWPPSAPSRANTIPKFRTHYDNLKVAKDAPTEVVRAAYRTLSQKYHPDKNQGSAEAARIMAIINASYEILADPEKRQKHDIWIAQQERLFVQNDNSAAAHQWAPSNKNTTYPQYPGTSPLSQPVERSSSANIIIHIFRNWALYGFAVFFVWIYSDIIFNEKHDTLQSDPKPYQAIPPEESRTDFGITPAPLPLIKPEPIRSHVAPNGKRWPAKADYIKGYPKLRTSGLSSVTVDNSQNDSDVFVKLVFLGSDKGYPVRQFYIPAFSRFTLVKVNAGDYDIRYRDLSSGELSRSEPFSLTEIQTSKGTQYGNITMTLYKVQNGNMQTYKISEAEF